MLGRECMEVKRMKMKVCLVGEAAVGKTSLIRRFVLDDFEQVQKMPQVLLKHRQRRNCQVRMWEEGEKVTVAFNSCPASCEGKAFDYLWPIVVETKSGRCY